ncbi:ribosome maturation factor RimP [Glycomyces buryatensis]|uniref:Ribosome maturation factor RimP n=1 Tax=Glycomyces buryatensis TaxID=2570927 RepID=A0A4S8QRG0_9ACTN|nr:ribosome maturation factor RimP [Glycomyces buryatensis]THV43244.1 ribosome maturation factor RimP [Glycomyces buryatensis]
MGVEKRNEIEAIVKPAVEKAGFDLEGLQVTKAGRRLLVRVQVDKDGGISLDDVAVASKACSGALDAAETTGGPFADDAYTLEVSSPGVDRPLTEPRHWRRNIGRLVAVHIGEEPVTGRVVAASERGIELEVDGESRSATYAELGSGKVQIELK